MCLCLCAAGPQHCWTFFASSSHWCAFSHGSSASVHCVCVCVGEIGVRTALHSVLRRPRGCFLDTVVVELWMAPLSGATYFCAPPEFWELICVRMCREFVFSVRSASRYVLVCSYVVYAFRDSYLRQRMYSCACAVSVFSVWFTLRVSVRVWVCACVCVRGVLLAGWMPMVI